MHTYSIMQANGFETQKNVKALAITVFTHALLLLIFFWIAFAVPVVPPPVPEEGIEVNLGNSDIGFGDVQPLVPDAPAPDAQEDVAPPRQQQTEAIPDQEKETTNREDADVPEIVKADKKSTPVKNKPVDKEPSIAKNKPSTTIPVTNPTPAPKKPKAVFSGGTGTGGNNSDTYNNSRNQGIAGGSGDQGKPNGNSNSDNYNGNGGSGRSGGPRVTNGNRKIIKYYSFQGELEKATIFAIVKVSPEGKGTFVGFGKNSTARSQAYANAITSYLKNIQFDRSNEESTVTVQFNFTVND